jgi:hypothetical protein
MSESVADLACTMEAAFSGVAGGQGIPARILKLIGQVALHWQEGAADHDLSGLTDSELLMAIATTHAKASVLHTREGRKLLRRSEARIKFLESLEQFGGLLKTKAVAELLGMTRQSVNNHVAKGTLISVGDGHDHLFPAFQFTDKGKIPYLEEVISRLRPASPEMICSFFLNPISLLGGKEKLPAYALRNLENEELFVIFDNASLYGTGVPS